MRPRDLVRAELDAGRLDLTPAELVILWDLADRAGTTGVAFESAHALADRYRWHYRTVRRALGRIEAAGLVRVERRPGAPSRYRFPVDNPVADVHNPAPMSAHPSTGTPRRSARNPAPMSAQPRADRRAKHREHEEHDAHGRAGRRASSPPGSVDHRRATGTRDDDADAFPPDAWPVDGATGALIARLAAADERARRTHWRESC